MTRVLCAALASRGADIRILFVLFRSTHRLAWQTVFGVACHPVDKGVIATGCHDHCVRVFTAVGDVARLVLRGHDDRVFNVAFSPLPPHLLASGSDDCTYVISPVS